MLFLDAAPYVVLLGDVGTGKSTIVEKLTGERNRSSSAEESFTTSAGLCTVEGPAGKNLVISDTPGSNAMSDNFKHNIWIAQAMNFLPVSKILITVKAGTRIDNLVRKVSQYEEGFLDLEDMDKNSL